MPDVLDIPFKADDGKIPSRVWEQLGQAVSRMDGKRLILSLKEQKKRRSLSQNAYMWGVVIARITKAFRAAGNNVDDEDVFSFLKAEVWKVSQVFVTPDGEVLRGPGSSRAWTTAEMELRLEEARAWAAEVLGESIPLPNEALP